VSDFEELAAYLFAAWVSGYSFGFLIYWFRRVTEFI
jgi:hypothetical protein